MAEPATATATAAAESIATPAATTPASTASAADHSGGSEANRDDCSGRHLGTPCTDRGHADRSVGCVLGALCGDVLGIPAEAHHMTSRQIKTQYGELRDFIPTTCLGLPRNVVRLGSYSDDTNSSLALATSLTRCGGLDAAHVARTYGSFWLKDPERGYPESAKMSMVAVQLGVDPTLTGRLAFPDGSFANGGAMRIAPVGIAFRHASDAELRLAVRHAICSSHVHPEAVDGAFIMAKAVALLATTQDPAGFDPAAFLETLKGCSQHRLMRKKISSMKAHWGKAMWPAIVWALAEDDEAGRTTPGPECNQHESRRWFQIHASTAVACAIWAFLSNWRNPEEVVVKAVGLGGDADTVGSMAGALAGALHGSAWLPPRWLDTAENRDYAEGVARRLAELDLRTPLGAVDLGGEGVLDEEEARKLHDEACTALEEALRGAGVAEGEGTDCDGMRALLQTRERERARAKALERQEEAP